MDKRWPARLALLIMTAVSLAVMSMWGGTLPFGISAFAQATPTPTRTPTPTATSTRACTFPPPPLPCPPRRGNHEPYADGDGKSDPHPDRPGRRDRPLQDHDPLRRIGSGLQGTRLVPRLEVRAEP